LLVIGIEYAAFLALLAFVGELIPVVGLTLAMIPAALVALSEGGLALAGVVFVAYFIIGQIENHILYPNVMNKMVGVPSVVVIISLIVGAKLAGFWGILIAVPLAAIMIGFLDDLDNHKIPEVN
jgi:predicted PurR-regulated permease PerM